MKLPTLVLAIIGNLAATQVYAQDAVVQPLTRADCDKAGMAWDAGANVCAANPFEIAGQPLTRPDCLKARQTWNDDANVCGAAPQATTTETASSTGEADTPGQPLTRKQCGSAGMKWNDATNVCAQQTAESPSDPENVAKGKTSRAESSILVTIDKGRQKMTVLLDGVEQYAWPVSTGLRGYSTPSGTYAASSMNKIWYSKQWDNAPMPHAVFFTKEGHAIHGTYDVKRLGKPASHGCVRLSPENASKLYALVEKSGLENTQVVLVGLTPGGESKVASPATSKPRYARSASRELSVKPEAQKPKRGGLFRRLFGGP